MAELLAENYHNIWARKKKVDLEAKGRAASTHLHVMHSFIHVIEKIINVVILFMATLYLHLTNLP